MACTLPYRRGNVTVKVYIKNYERNPDVKMDKMY